MEWILRNPRKGITKVFIRMTFGGKYHLYLKYDWMPVAKIVGSYAFSSDSAAKRYYSTNYQSVKQNAEKPKWEKINDENVHELTLY